MTILGIGLLLFQVQLGSATGIVTKPGGIEPLSGATVTLTPVAAAQASRGRTTVSEDDGRFTISNIEPGEYRLLVQSARYGGAAFGQRKPNGPGAILTVAPGQRLSDLKLSLAPTGTIAGRITGASGEPIANASVQALKFLYQEGKRVLSVVQTATTDDRGDYRIFWLTSGTYAVVAAPRSSPLNTAVSVPLKPGEADSANRLIVASQMSISAVILDGTNLVKRILEDGTIREESWMPTYYPSTTDRNQATPIEVAAGSTVPGVNITLGPSPVLKVRGRVTGFTTQATVSLAPATQGIPGGQINKGASTIDGSFEFPGILPGPYYLTAQDRAGLVASPIAVMVGDRDVDNLTIGVAAGVTVSARITAEGTTPGSLDPLTGINGRLRPELDGLPPGGQIVRVAPIQGSNLVFGNIPAGNYQFDIGQGSLQENLKRFYIKSVRVGVQDALSTVRVTSGTDIVLDVVLTTQTGSVEGVATGRAGDPAGNATVVLIPTTARNRMSLYQTVVAGTDGKFRFQEIPPGDYKLFAWDDVETGAWANAEFVRTYESRGRAIRVSENSKENVPLNVIYNP
jgi:hypothetical protein